MTPASHTIDDLVGAMKDIFGVNKPTVPEVLPVLKAYLKLPGNNVGGSFHAVLDDGNTQDCHVKWCLEYAREKGDAEGVKLGELLLRCSRTQRIKLASLMYE